jgi:hypothetical protein
MVAVPLEDCVRVKAVKSGRNNRERNQLSKRDLTGDGDGDWFVEWDFLYGE